MRLRPHSWEHGFYLPSEDFLAEVGAPPAPARPLPPSAPPHPPHSLHPPHLPPLLQVSAAYAPDATLVLLCANGRLAKGAAAVLEGAAFTNVQTLEGGLDAWAWEAEEEGRVPPLVVDDDVEGGLPERVGLSDRDCDLPLYSAPPRAYFRSSGEDNSEQ